MLRQPAGYPVQQYLPARSFASSANAGGILSNQMVVVKSRTVADSEECFVAP